MSDELSQARADVEHYAQLCREYCDRAETAQAEREAWEENHQILAEHFQRMSHRAERAEAKLGDVRDDRNHWESVAHGWHSEVEKLQHERLELDKQVRHCRLELSALETAYDELNKWVEKTETNQRTTAERADTWFELSKALMRALLAMPHESTGGTS